MSNQHLFQQQSGIRAGFSQVCLPRVQFSEKFFFLILHLPCACVQNLLWALELRSAASLPPGIVWLPLSVWLMISFTLAGSGCACRRRSPLWSGRVERWKFSDVLLDFLPLPSLSSPVCPMWELLLHCEHIDFHPVQYRSHIYYNLHYPNIY